MTLALPVRGAAPTVEHAAWRRHGAVLAGVALLLLIGFGRDAADLARLWWTSTTFGHCLFIGPVIGWLVWMRRGELAALPPQGWAPGLAIVAGGAGLWLVGAAAGVALARHLGLVVMLQGSVVTILGPRVGAGLAFPLAYAFFLVPFGEGLEPPLQRATVAMVLPLLHLAGVPARVDGVLITIPGGYFEVAEACSGAKFVIAMAAFGVLVANVGYLRWTRRIAFVAAALIVPVFANALRAFGTIYAAHLTSVAAATGFDHILYGWLFFGLVMALVLALGWRWFDRDPAAPWIDVERLPKPGRAADPLVAAAMILAAAGAAQAASIAIDARADPLPMRLALPDVPGWHQAPPGTRAPWRPNYPGAEHFLFGRYVNARGQAVDLAIAVYASQREGHELIGYGLGPVREEDRWVKVADLPPVMGGAAIRITAAGPVERVVLSWHRIGGTTTANPAIAKLATLKARLLGGRQAAVAVHVSAENPGGEAAVARFLAALGSVDALADHMRGMR